MLRCFGECRGWVLEKFYIPVGESADEPWGAKKKEGDRPFNALQAKAWSLQSVKPTYQ